MVHSLRQLLGTVELPIDLQHEALFQISTGLEYLHEKRVVHGHLKSANVLLTGGQEEFIFKLGDFGQIHATITSKLSTSMSAINGNRSRTGTISFEAPEVFCNAKKTAASDIYAFAMVVYEVRNRAYEYPWQSVFGIGVHPDTLAAQIIAAVKKGERPTTSEVSPFTNLMMKCWASDPVLRPTASQLVKDIVAIQVTVYWLLSFFKC